MTLAEQSTNMAELVALQAYVPRNVIAVVTRYPEQADDYLKAAIRALMELHPEFIGDFRNNFDISYNRHDAAERPNEVHCINDAVSNIRMRYGERYGRAIENAYREWVSMDGEISIDVLFIEPDPTNRKAVRAWKVNGHKPTSVKSDDSRRDLDSTRDQGRVEVFFRNDSMKTGEDVNAEANEYLEKVDVRRSDIAGVDRVQTEAVYQQLDDAIRAAVELFVPPTEIGNTELNRTLLDRPAMAEKYFREEIVRSLHIGFIRDLNETMSRYV